MIYVAYSERYVHMWNDQTHALLAAVIYPVLMKILVLRTVVVCRFVYCMDVHTDAGSPKSWRVFHHDVEFSGYSIMTFDHHQKLLVLGNLYGCIKVLMANEGAK